VKSLEPRPVSRLQYNMMLNPVSALLLQQVLRLAGVADSPLRAGLLSKDALGWRAACRSELGAVST
jgi:hypothetical protein